MRNAFLDEAGTSRNEDWVIVAGVIIDADHHWLAIERHLQRLVDENFPEEVRASSFFHSHMIYQGRTPFDRAHGWDEGRRFSVLEKLSSIPDKFDIPIVYGFCNRKKMERAIPPNAVIKDRVDQAHFVACSMAIVQVERFMRIFVPNSAEVAKITIEDRQKMREHLKEATRYLRDVTVTEAAPDHVRDMIPLTRVVGTPQFEEKRDASILQIADVCAYVIKRRFMGDKMIERFFAPMRTCFPFANDTDRAHPMFKPWEGASE